MEVSQSKNKFIVICILLSGATFVSWFYSLKLLLNSDSSGATGFFIFGLIFLIYPYAFYRLLNTKIEFSNDGVNSNKLNKLGFNGLVEWENIKRVSYGSRKGLDYIDIHIDPEYIRKGLRAPKNKPTVLYEREVRIYTEVLDISNKNIAYFINNKLKKKNLKNKDIDIYSFLEKLEEML